MIKFVTTNSHITAKRIVSNNRIPPRLRSRCSADSPQRGEYRALGTRLRRGQQCYSVVITALRA
jgi:hypothetical protein